MTRQQELQARVDSIRRDLYAIDDGRYNFAEGRIIDDDNELDEIMKDFASYEEDFGGGFARYFEDALDVEYRVDSQLRYKSVIITVALGNPEKPAIHVDTFTRRICGYWGYNTADTILATNIIPGKIDAVFKDRFNRLRDC